MVENWNDRSFRLFVLNGLVWSGQRAGNWHKIESIRDAIWKYLCEFMWFDLAFSPLSQYLL